MHTQQICCWHLAACSGFLPQQQDVHPREMHSDNTIDPMMPQDDQSRCLLSAVACILHFQKMLPSCSWSSLLLYHCRWAAVLGIILALSRALVQEPGVAFDPELALLEVVAHTHYLPRHWRGRAHTREVHHNFQALFPFKVCTSSLSLFSPAISCKASLRGCSVVLIRCHGSEQIKRAV